MDGRGWGGGFKYLWVLFMCDGKKEDEMDRRFEVPSVVMKALYQIVVVKTQFSNKAKLSIYWSVYILTLPYGHEIRVVTKRTKLWIEADEMKLLWGVAGLNLRDRVRSPGTSE